MPGVKIVGKIDLNNLNPRKQEKPETKPESKPKPETKSEPAPQIEVVPEQKAAETPPEPVQPVAEEKLVPEPVTPVVEAANPIEIANEEAGENEVVRARADRLSGPNIVGKITLPVEQPRRKDQPVASSSNIAGQDHKRKRKRKDGGPAPFTPGQPGQSSQSPAGQGQQPGNRPGGGYQGNRPQGAGGGGYQGNRPQGGRPTRAGKT